MRFADAPGEREKSRLGDAACLPTPAAILLAGLLLASGSAVPTLAQTGGPSIHGTLIGADGQPAGGVRVELRRWSPSHTRRLVDLALAEPDVVVTARSDPKGRFAVTAPDLGSFELHVLPENAAPLRQRYVPLLEDVEEGTIALRRAESLTVAVTGAGGKPIADAVVVVDTATPRVRGGDRFPPWPPRQSARTDPQGHATFAVLAGADRAIHVVAPGHLRSSQRSGADRVDVALRPAPTAVLEVRDARGRPVEGAVVREGDDLIARGVTDDAGRFEVPVSPEGSAYQVESAELGYGSARLDPPAQQPDGAPPVRVVELESAARVEGRVVDASTGDPIGGAAVWASRRPEDLTYTSPEGTYSLLTWTDSAGAALRAAARGFSAADLRVSHAQLAERDTPTVALAPAGALTGTIVGPDDEPLAGAQITAATTGPRSLGRASHTVGAASAPDGSFRVTGLPSETPIELRVTREGFADLWRDLGPLDPAAPALRLQLTRGLLATGRVVDADDRPLSGVALTLWSRPPDGNRWSARAWRMGEAGTATSDADGTFRFPAVGAGSYDLEARKDGYARTEVPGVELTAEPGIGEAEVEIGTVLLPPGARVEGKVVDADGRGVGGIAIAAIPQQVERLRPPRPGDREPQTTTAADGRFTIDDLPHDVLVELAVVDDSLSAVAPTFVRTPTPETVILEVTGSIVLRGTVVAAGSGAPLPGATVHANPLAGAASSPGRLGGRAVTDDTGRFELRTAASGTFRIYASALGHVSSARTVTVGKAPLDDLVLQLDEGATLVGRIVGPKGEPVIGARLLAGAAFSASNALSDGEGRYRLEGVSIGENELRIQHPDYRPVERRIQVEAGEAVADFELDEGLEIAGRVTDANGEPVTGATVRPIPVGGFGTVYRLGGSNVVTTGADGGFALRGLGAGTFELQAEHEDSGSARSAPITLDERSQGGVELRLEQGITVVGLVQGVPFDQLSQVSVMARPRSGAPGSAIWRTGTALDFEGRFEIRGLRPGRVTLFATRQNDGQSVSAEVELHAGETPEPVLLDFDTEGTTLSGTVLLDGKPVSGADVTLIAHRSSPGMGSNRRSVTDHQGRFALDGVVEGEWTISAVRDDASASESVQVLGDTDVTLNLASTSVEVTVVDAVSGDPLSGAEVMVSGPSGFFRSSLGQLTDANGRFTSGAYPGSAYVNVELSGYVQASETLQLEAGETRRVRIELARAAPFELVVLQPDGAPYQGALSLLVANESGGRGVQAHATAEPGRYSARDVAPGAWKVTVSPQGFPPAILDVTVPTAGPVRVQLQGGGHVHVSVPELAQESRAFVVAMEPGASPRNVSQWQGAARGVAPLVAGEATLGPLPPGTWQLMVQIYDERATAASSGVDLSSLRQTHQALVQVLTGETVDAVMRPTGQ